MAAVETIGLCPILVGREADVETLTDLLTAAAAGQGRVVVLAGEAGIGKSRLVQEAWTAAQRMGMVCRQGQCLEADRALPFGPFLDLLRGDIAAQAPAAAAAHLRPYAAELIKLLPEVAALVPEVAPTPALPPELEKRRLFQTLAHYLQASSDAGRLVVVEDVHWADEISLEFVRFLAREVGAQPSLLLLTYRSDEANADLRHHLAEMDRLRHNGQRLLHEVALSRLGAAEVALMIRATFAQAEPVREAFATLIHDFTDGNPFFVEETLRALVASGDVYQSSGGWTRKPITVLRVPRTVQDAVQRRAGRLSAEARTLLTLAAVAGQRVEFELLQAVSGHTEGELVAAVKELVAVQLLLEDQTEGIVFRHALIQQAILEGLLSRERRSIHRRLLTALEAAPGAPLEALARHAFAAEAWAAALTYAQRAGERAQALYAPRAALTHYTQALTAAHHLGAPPPLTVLRERGQMHQTAGEFELARTDYEALLHHARAQVARRMEWQALVDLGFLWVARDYDEAGRYFEAALALAPHLEDPATVAATLNRVGNWHANSEQPVEAVRYHKEALRVYEALGDRAGLAATHDLLGIANYILGDIVAAVHHYQHAITLFRALNDLGGLTSSLIIVSSRGADYLGSTAVVYASTLAERLRDATEALRLSRETGQRPGEAMSLLWIGLNHAIAGGYGPALTFVQQGLALAEAMDHRHFMTVGHLLLGTVYLDLLAFERARTHLVQALDLARQTNSRVWVGVITGNLALTELGLGDVARAEAVLQQALAPETPVVSFGQRQMWFASARCAQAAGEPRRALALAEQLIRTAPNNPTGEASGLPRLALLRAEALMSLGHLAEAETSLLAALTAAHALDLASALWRLYLALGRVYLARGKRDEGAAAFASAQAILAPLAAAIPEAPVRDGFLRRAAAPMARVDAASARRRAKQQSGGLTRREREVARLIAEGQANKEIADALTLSPRTVEVHVANIMGKLGVSNRAQIAAWVASRNPGPAT